MTQEIRVLERFDIEAEDGQLLAATLHAPIGRPKAALQIHAGMGIKRKFYRHFAVYLASHGYAVLTFDFRGTGDSRPEDLRGYRATLSDWGRKDIPAALEWLAESYPNIPRFAIAHSVGGQITGLMHNHELLSGLVLMFAYRGELYKQPLLRMLQGIALLGVFIPLSVPLFGYAPVRFLMKAQDLPAGVALEWTRWFLHVGWIAGYFRARSEEIFYGKIKAPIRAFALEDDSMGTPANCERLLRDYYNGAPSELTTFRTTDVPESQRPGHLTYFQSRFAESYWTPVLAWLDERSAQAQREAAEREPAALSA
jgi:predicted alpha/beta hydrolase